MFYGGARSGKTFLIVYAILWRAMHAAGTRHAMFRLRGNHARASLWLETVPEVTRVFWPDMHLEDHIRDGYIGLPNGSEVWIAGADDKDRVEKILGKQFITLYFNECSQIPYSTILLILTRLAQTHPELQQRAIYDLNPVGTRHYTSQLFIAGRDPLTQRPLEDLDEYRYAFINPRDNSANLSPAFIRSLETMPERQRRRFYDGVFQAEIDGALWTLEKLARARCDLSDVPRDLRRVVVAIDPSGTAGDEDKRSDNVGIVVVGKGLDDQSYVLADRTCNLPPEGWSRVAVNAYHEFNADCIVAEANFGGDMVRALLHNVDRNITVRLVKASRGKVVRAEPISALYGHERDGAWVNDQVRHAGEFPQLEDQLLNFSTAGYMGDRSPDRADACIAEGMLVTTQAGDIPIEDVRAGDLVLTRVGWRQVIASRQTRRSAPTLRLVTTRGTVIATPDHRIWTAERGFIRLDAVMCADTLLACTPITNQHLCGSPALNTGASQTVGLGLAGFITRLTLTAAALKAWGSCTSRYGARITAELMSRKGTSFITPTTIRSTTTPETWWPSLTLNTERFTPIRSEHRNIWRKWEECARWLLSGIGAPPAGPGIANMAAGPGSIAHPANLNAPNAAPRSRHWTLREALDFALRPARAAQKTARELTNSWLTAKFVARSSGKAFIGQNRKLVPASVVQNSEDAGLRPVYDLTVDGQPEFFAGGLLVHNCIWALTDLYIEQGKDQGYVEWLREAAAEVKARQAPPPPEPTMSWEDKRRLRREQDLARARAEDEAVLKARRGEA